jgi:hypothetical protein
MSSHRFIPRGPLDPASQGLGRPARYESSAIALRLGSSWATTSPGSASMQACSDEILVHVVPVLFSEGVRLLDGPAVGPGGVGRIAVPAGNDSHGRLSLMIVSMGDTSG